jgi:cellulose synthase/poly-beta-1,6-N-acetylglucosamine synthase-like glycosyltransferase
LDLGVIPPIRNNAALDSPAHPSASLPDAADRRSLSMTKAAKMTVVLPVRDREQEIRDRVENLLEALAGMTRETTEIVVVDDGSRDATAEVLEEMRMRYPQIRIVRHPRPRGMEAAGQTGLERATGELVFIQESNTCVRAEDMRRLYQMSGDLSVVAARAESKLQPVSGALLRRLRAWGTSADQQLDLHAAVPNSSMQMIRRSHLQRLAAPGGNRYHLHGETSHTTSTQRV